MSIIPLSGSTALSVAALPDALDWETILQSELE